jgi:hypothetical protein
LHLAEPYNALHILTPFIQVKYRVGDKVFLNEQGSRGLKGPYVIATALDTGTYTLCHEDGKEVEGGAMFSEKVLLPAD